MGISREILLKVSESQWLAAQLTRREFTRRAVQRFMPGEDMDSALTAAASLRQRGLPAILSLLGENVADERQAEEVAQHYLQVLDKQSERGLEADISVKPTQLGLDLSLEGTCDRLSRLAGRAAALKRVVAIDMESTPYAEQTINLYRKLRTDHGNVAVCLQAYLHRTATDLAALLPLAPTIRLVKGAYKESARLAFRRKRDVDASFLRLADTLLHEVKEGGARAFFGTHDPAMITGIVQRAKALGLPRDAFEIQMLYGIQRELQSSLAHGGYRVRVLISYGQSWFPWYMRRLAERPANLLFLVKNVFAR
jgi:proline dehydrogenase